MTHRAIMYKVIVTADGTTVTASKHCRTRAEAEQARAELLKCLKMPVRINIINIARERAETPQISMQGGETKNPPSVERICDTRQISHIGNLK